MGHSTSNEMMAHALRPRILFNFFSVLGAIQVLRNADGGGGVSDFLEKIVTKV